MIAIIKHSNKGSGAIDRFEDYLVRNSYRIASISHPLESYSDTDTYIKGLTGKVTCIPRKGGKIINLLYDFWLSIYFLARTKPQIVIGANAFDTLPAIILKVFVPSIQKIIFFGSDYSEKRFDNKVLNMLYSLSETLAVKGASLTISNTTRSEQARVKRGLKMTRSIVIPNVAHLEKPIFNKKTILKDHFIFVGALTSEHGLYQFIDECSSLIKYLDIAGDGPRKDEIIRLCKERGLNHRYHGQLSRDRVATLLTTSYGIGLAPYSPEAGQYIHYGSSLKMYEYAAHGLPVLAPDVTEDAMLLKQHGLGIIYKNMKKKNIKKTIEVFDTKLFHQKAKKFYEQYNYDKLYSRLKI